MVERLLAKEKVVGSNPIARSNDHLLGIADGVMCLSAIFLKPAISAVEKRIPGDVAKW